MLDGPIQGRDHVAAESAAAACAVPLCTTASSRPVQSPASTSTHAQRFCLTTFVIDSPSHASPCRTLLPPRTG